METMPQAAQDRWQPGNGIVLGAILAGAVLLTLKYFPGLENEVAYAGNAFQIIHPDAFAGDPYRPPDASIAERPLQLSLMYVLVKIVGDLWLDDRFLIFVYLGLVVAGLVGVDRTAKLLGISGLFERLIVLLMFLKDHAVLDHKVLLAHHADVNHMAFAIPIIVWLVYATLAGKKLWMVLAVAALLAATSLRTAFFPILFCLAVVVVNGTRRERLVVLALCIVGTVVAYWGLFHAFAVPEETRLQLWSYIRRQEEGDANPYVSGVDYFHARLAWWTILCGAAYFLSLKSIPAFRGVRVIMVMAFATFILGGLYISYAPDALKQPLLIGLAPNRALAWAQNLAYIAILAAVFRGFGFSTAGREAALACLTVLVLFIAGPGNLVKWTFLVILSGMAMLMLHGFGRPVALTTRGVSASVAQHLQVSWRLIVFQVLAVCLAIVFAIMLWTNASGLRTFFHSGIWYNNPSAAWVGVDQFIRNNTPKTASVLPLTDRPEYYQGKIKATRSLATRGGRAIPVPEVYGPNFRDVRSWEFVDRQSAVIEAIEEALKAGDLQVVSQNVESLRPVPDYIVLPKTAFQEPGSGIPSYTKETAIRGYAILRRND